MNPLNGRAVEGKAMVGVPCASPGCLRMNYVPMRLRDGHSVTPTSLGLLSENRRLGVCNRRQGVCVETHSCNLYRRVLS